MKLHSHSLFVGESFPLSCYHALLSPLSCVMALKRDEWLYFEDVGNAVAKCKICQKMYSYKATADLRLHLERKHDDLPSTGPHQLFVSSTTLTTEDLLSKGIRVLSFSVLFILESFVPHSLATPIRDTMRIGKLLMKQFSQATPPSLSFPGLQFQRTPTRTPRTSKSLPCLNNKILIPLTFADLSSQTANNTESSDIEPCPVAVQEVSLLDEVAKDRSPPRQRSRRRMKRPSLRGSRLVARTDDDFGRLIAKKMQFLPFALRCGLEVEILRLVNSELNKVDQL